MPTLREKPRERTHGTPTRSRSRREPPQQSAARRHFVAATAEFVGTFLFLFFAFLGHSMSATQAGITGPGDTASSETIVFISLSYAFSLLVTAWTMYRISGGLFNPAVTLGLVASGSLPAIRGLILFPAQILGAICAAAVASAIIPGDIAIVQTTLGPGMSIVRGVFLEMFLTAQLVLTIIILAAEKSKDTFIAPIGIGLALFVVEIAGVYYTGGSVNPARSFGPCVAAASFQGYHWIYWIGPFLGGLLAAGFYRFIKWMNQGDLDEANPGQDSAGGAFDAKIEETQSRQAEEGQAEPVYSRNSQSRSSWDGRGQNVQSWNAPAPPPQSQQQNSSWDRRAQQAQSWNAPPPPPPPQQQQQNWGANTGQAGDRRSGDLNRDGSRRRY